MTSISHENVWTTKQAYLMAIICLALGVAVGYLAHPPSARVELGSSAIGRPAAVASPAPVTASLPDTRPSPGEMLAAGERAAFPVLEQLKSDPRNFKLLVEAGEMYYHHGAYAEAAGYYKRALALQDNYAVRNQYASALFYSGDPNGALREYAKVLKEKPTDDVALFNSGMIEYKAKNDGKTAVKFWQRLLNAYPNHPQRDRVEKMIEQVSSQLALH